MSRQVSTQQRLEEALKLLGDGYGCTELVAVLAEKWGCSRRTSRRYVAKAYAAMVDDLGHVEASDMLATIINRLERIARRAEAAGQFGAAVGACRTLGELVVTPHRHKSHFGRFPRSS
jgi:hypothetical protein